MCCLESRLTRVSAMVRRRSLAMQNHCPRWRSAFDRRAFDRTTKRSRRGSWKVRHGNICFRVRPQLEVDMQLKPLSPQETDMLIKYPFKWDVPSRLETRESSWFSMILMMMFFLGSAGTATAQVTSTSLGQHRPTFVGPAATGCHHEGCSLLTGSFPSSGCVA